MRALLLVGLLAGLAGCQTRNDPNPQPKAGDVVGGGVNKGGAIGANTPETGHANPAGPGAAK